jgi:hypothetical protein
MNRLSDAELAELAEGGKHTYFLSDSDAFEIGAALMHGIEAAKNNGGSAGLEIFTRIKADMSNQYAVCRPLLANLIEARERIGALEEGLRKLARWTGHLCRCDSCKQRNERNRNMANKLISQEVTK